MDMENKIILTIKSEKSIGFRNEIRIYVDTVQLGSLRNDEELNYNLEYGRHKIEAKVNNKTTMVEINVNSSNNGVEVIISPKSGLFNSKPKIKAVNYR